MAALGEMLTEWVAGGVPPPGGFQYRLRLRVGRDGQPGLTRLRPGGGRIETASRRHRPPLVNSMDFDLILNRSILFQNFPHHKKSIQNPVRPLRNLLGPSWELPWIIPPFQLSHLVDFVCFLVLGLDSLCRYS